MQQRGFGQVCLRSVSHQLCRLGIGGAILVPQYSVSWASGLLRLLEILRRCYKDTHSAQAAQAG